MASQNPSGSISLLKGFNGYLDDVKFCNTPYQIPMNIEDISSNDCLLDMTATLPFLNEQYFQNKGTDAGQVKLRRAAFTTKLVLFESFPVQFGPDANTPAPTKQIFDGITCADNHMTLALESYDTSLTFNTIEFA